MLSGLTLKLENNDNLWWETKSSRRAAFLSLSRIRLGQSVYLNQTHPSPVPTLEAKDRGIGC